MQSKEGLHPSKPASVAQINTQPIVSVPLSQFALSAVAGAICIVCTSDWLFQIAPLETVSVVVGVLLYFFATTFAGFYLNRDYPHPVLGACNLVTLARLVIVAVLFVVVIEKVAPSWVTFAIAIFALCLDGVDGWLARKQGLSSDFGAHFDVEVDAAFALVLAVYAATNGVAGPVVILLGLPHYLFWMVKTRLPWLRQSLPERFSRKMVCVFQIAALAALQLPLLSHGRLDIIITLVTLALLWSFGRDIFWLWRAKKC